MAKNKRSAQMTHCKSTLSWRALKDQEGKWKENWVRTSKMSKDIPWSIDYIHKRLKNSGCLSVKTGLHPSNGPRMCYSTICNLKMGQGALCADLPRYIVKWKKIKVQNKGYIFHLRKRRMDWIIFLYLHKNSGSIYKKLIKVFPHGVWGSRGWTGWGRS